MRIAFLIFMLVSARLVSAQDITGIWRGSFNSKEKVMDIFDIEDRYKLEVQLDQRNKSFEGVTYSYKTTVFYGKATASGTINPGTGKIKMMELKLVEVKMQQYSSACIMTYSLQYKKNGEEEFLEGTYTSFNEEDSMPCGKGVVRLRKVTTSDFHKEPFLVKRELEKTRKKEPAPVPDKKTTAPLAKNTTPKSTTKVPLKPLATKPSPTTAATKPPATKPPAVKPPVTKPLIAKKSPSTISPGPLKKGAPQQPANSPRPFENKSMPDIVRTDSPRNETPTIKKVTIIPKVLTTRENELVKTITVNSNVVSINIYDNGTIDHDTVSVYLDKKLVVSKQMLTTRPITVTFDMNDTNDVHELVMVAENLGDFPPNTSLMVVRAGDKEYEVRITSTEQKNAVVVFKYEKGK